MIREFGGIYFEGDRNLGNPGSLEHVLQEIQGSVFGHDPYPTLIEKAAAVAWRIIVTHVFHDGNKRTGMEACRQLLELNGYVMRIERQPIVDMALDIATGKVQFHEFLEWLKERTTKVQ